MTSFFRELFESKSNGPQITKLLLDELEVPVTLGTLTRELETHPNYNSLLSISDVLNQFGVDNLTARFEGDKLFALPTPFITQLRGLNKPFDYFSIVKGIEEERIHYYDPISLKWTYSSKDDFLKRHKGVALLAEVGDHAGEKDFNIKSGKEKKKRTLTLLGIMIFPMLLLLTAITGWKQYGTAILPSLLYALLCLSGAVVGLLLLWYEIDQHNPALQQICSAGEKTNCGAILQSGAAKVVGVSWSAIGFTYFTGSLLLMQFAGFNSPLVLFTLSLLSLLALPYTIFSIYYQMRVARQWCVLCLFVQAILVLQFATLLITGRINLLASAAVDAAWLPSIITAYLLPITLSAVLLPVFKKAKEGRENMIRLQQIKHNPQIFEALLAKQKRVSVPEPGMGITLGNPAAIHKIIKVCSPYCGPCAKAHAPMEALLENNPDIQVQIIFTASNSEEDRAAAPAKHLLAIADQHKDNDLIIKQALDDWYLAKEKDYGRFAAKYPMNGALKYQDGKIDAMSQWCEGAGIGFTPTFFINGYQMPDIYTVADLRYFLAV